ncbi:putative S-adenosyl-L-methionine-dependent methyltransferase [Mycena venus]|uniref:Putative S-adenosyl-L-methionine-dependent methyltransferase n=1 Tax=Mycena venus TaxID=2733690 RepID=A0A8H6X3D6_9AGAR|nr:putative S-adenosyl-L-methionine-dependent methyltransferase [Mycena venus]
MASSLIDLCTLISTSVATVDARCKALAGTYPDLNNPTNSKESEALLNDDEIANATSIALAAASQLIASMQYPSRSILDASYGFVVSTALGVVAESSTAEIIREAGPQVLKFLATWSRRATPTFNRGCHINDIAKKNGMDPTKIARVLRPLATQHIFRELSPDVFAHNRISALIDTGKSFEAIQAAPEDKYAGAEGHAALILLNTDETFKAAGYIQDVVLDKVSEASDDEFNTPLNKAFGTHIDLFSWYEKAENRKRFKRFGFAMDVSRKLSPPGAILQGFKWSALPEKTLIVDVGGGIGSISLEIAQANPHLRFLIQDTQAVIREGEQHWETELPGALAAGRVSFGEHDFFGPQSVKNADIFLLRYIVHDWSDAYSFKILKHLRDAAQSTTKLIVVEHIVPLACEEDDAFKHIPGAVPTTLPPKPLLPNLGVVNMMPYFVDIQMMALLRGCERTFPHYWDLLKKTGWEIEEVYRPLGSLVSQIVAKPI